MDRLFTCWRGCPRKVSGWAATAEGQHPTVRGSAILTLSLERPQVGSWLRPSGETKAMAKAADCGPVRGSVWLLARGVAERDHACWIASPAGLTRSFWRKHHPPESNADPAWLGSPPVVRPALLTRATLPASVLRRGKSGNQCRDDQAATCDSRVTSTRRSEPRAAEG